MIEVFVRHCHFSHVSAHKTRFPGFSRERCFQNLIDSLQGERKVRVTTLLDTFHPMTSEHFLYRQSHFPVVDYQAGSEAASFVYLLDYVLGLDLDPDTIVYFLEDDYFHRPHWPSILREGIQLPGVDYVTLYDHRDKYESPDYAQLLSKIFCTESCHWRTTPSTTNTYAMRFGVLKRDQEVHRAFSLDRSISLDHAKFCHLAQLGRTLISSLPGYATHLEPDYASPCINWKKLLKSPQMKWGRCV